MENGSTSLNVDNVVFNSIPTENSTSSGTVLVTYNEEHRRFTTTSWILGWAELLHLIPLASSFLYSSYLLKEINCYQIPTSN